MKHSVGIFSRQDRSDYAWLVELFSSSNFSDRVKDVTSTVISNSGFAQFIDDASKCSLGIIYHTKNRGRINITDIQGSLYDEELETLHNLLGRDNVIVVIDDVENNSQEEKIRILELQPSIEKLACDLLLISKTEKKTTKALMTKVGALTPFHSASALHGGNTHRDPPSGRPNLEEKLTDTPEAKYKTEDSKPLHIPTTIYEVLKPLSSNRGPEVSFTDEDHETQSDYVNCKPIRESLTPKNATDIQCCNKTETGYSSENENIYETPDAWIANDRPEPELCYEMSKMCCSSGNSETPPEEEYPAFNDDITKELPDQGCSPSAHRSPRHHWSNENWSQVLDELKGVLKEKPQ